MKENTKLLTIGQFADLHGINKKTLMWYDQIGLFAPAAVNPENGYRYYNYHQSSILETILLLRELDVSIKEIQDFMNNRSAFSLKSQSNPGNHARATPKHGNPPHHGSVQNIHGRKRRTLSSDPRDQR